MKTEIVSVKQKGVLQKAAKALKQGKIIIYPTETSYGIGCDAKNIGAIKKIHKIKKEPLSKPLIILVPNLKTAKKFGALSKTDEILVKKFMPGPLTLVVEKKKRVFGHLDKKTIAFRISSNKFALALSKRFVEAIVSTSANIHGKPPIFSAKRAIEVFEGQVSLIVNAGKLPKRRPSTVYDSKKKKILRKGKILLEKLKKFSEKQ